MNQVNYSKHVNPSQTCLSTDVLILYSEGKLVGQEANRVEKHLLACPLCADALEGIQMFNDSDGFRQLLGEVNAKIQERAEKGSAAPAPAKKGRIITFPRALAAITSVAAILLVVMMVLPQGLSDIAGDYYQTPDGITQRGENPGTRTTKPATFQEGMNYYNAREYAKAAAAFESINTGEGQFFAASSYIEIGDYKKAETAFKRVLEINNGYVDDAKYHLGLTYLYLEDKASAIQILQEVVKSSNNQKDSLQAREILELLK